MRHLFLLISLVLIGGVVAVAWFYPAAWWLFLIVGPLVLLGIYDMLQKSNTILRNFPVLGHLRYFFLK